ncbi:MAG TPA: ABC transporter ATP-binding protein [Caulobacteraceae bacterium]|jgi:lipopolysaccharide transport system ATP-binding protein
MGRDVVIRAEGLGKNFIIGHQAERESYVALRDVIARNARNLWRTTTDVLKGRPSIEGDELEEFWALRDVSFEVERGEVVGVIGRNGAGKSTLLKVLSRITEPTEGRVEIRGRVASLLEVGTGFHPELTGRENIYLNGAVLGMTHGEIRRKFDEIIAFAEVERFLDTPVKRYSSGMYVRLAFAVAAHLEPEILIVDEVLAVGDAEFQKKCLGKMGEVAGEGRTVVFVSHNMGSVAQLCASAILLVKGRVDYVGSSTEVISRYTASGRRSPDAEGSNALYVRDSSHKVREGAILRATMLDRAGRPVSFVESDAPVTFRVTAVSVLDDAPLTIFIVLRDQLGRTLAKFESDPRRHPLAFEAGQASLECRIDNLPLLAGEYRFGVALAQSRSHIIDYQEDVATFSVLAAASDPRVAMSPWAEGSLAIRHDWVTPERGDLARPAAE